MVVQKGFGLVGTLAGRDDGRVSVPLESRLSETGKYGNREFGSNRKNRRKRSLSEREKDELIRGVHDGSLVGRRFGSQSCKRAIYSAAHIYAMKHQNYYGGHLIDSVSKVDRSKRICGCFSRAIAQASLLGCEVSDYLEAQFYWYDQWYGRAPCYNELSMRKAVNRVRRWLELKQCNGVPNSVVSVGKPRVGGKTKLSDKDIFEYDMKVLQEMIKQWGSEEVVWELFADEGLFSEEFVRYRRGSEK